MTILDELKRLGYSDVRPLEKLVYTDGKTYEFPQGMYFACYKESDTDVFNSKPKKLGGEVHDIVTLMIRNATSHDPNEWSARRQKSKTTNVYQFFNTKRIRAALRACDAGINITEFCGIVPVFKNLSPCSYVSHYEIEMKDMRDRLAACNKIDIDNLSVPWLTIEYPDGEKKQLTAAQHKVVAGYEMRKTDAAIRNKETKNTLGPNTSILWGVVDGKRIMVNIERHRAYMWTFMKHKKREHQNIVDHIDGNHSNNAPWNLRWVSTAENCLVKHTERIEYVVPDIKVLHETHGAPSNPMEWHGWTIHSNKWITRPDKSKFVARSTTGTYYPRIGTSIKNEHGDTEFHHIQCHQIVAYLHRIPTSERASTYLESLGKCRDHFQTFDGTYFEFAKELKLCNLVIMHADNDKSNYSFENLTIGTKSENADARHDNPETTLRKRVDLIDTTTHKRQKFDSVTQAAEWLKRHQTTISDVVRINRTREAGSYRATTHKLTGAKYYVVDAT